MIRVQQCPTRYATGYAPASAWGRVADGVDDTARYVNSSEPWIPLGHGLAVIEKRIGKGRMTNGKS